ncbi:MAG TPA: hypothetical protein VGR27_00745 [Longimicrobiaceae bacterium]|nr:hypothetical protein [Longimicrobiaceae bacterium]
MPLRRVLALARGLLLLALLAGAACTGAPRAEDRTAEHPEEDTLEYLDGEGAGMGEEPEPDFASEEYRRLGLTGVNKPNGMEYRLRHSVPAATPTSLPRQVGGLELFIADPAPEGWLGVYREPLERMEAPANPRFRAILFAEDGERFWTLDLNRFLSRPDHLEIQDVRYQEGELYFNEACQSYSREASGRCSSLVRVDPRRQAVEWRTPPLASNNIFILHGPHVIAGYGFTAEPDSLFWIRRETGEIVARRRLDSAHAYLEVREGELVVVTHSGRVDTLPAEPDRPR